jgi:hypothetical protein
MDVAGKYGTYRVTMTAFAQIRSLSAPSGLWCSPNLTATSANIQAVRAYVALMSE